MAFSASKSESGKVRFSHSYCLAAAAATTTKKCKKFDMKKMLFYFARKAKEFQRKPHDIYQKYDYVCVCVCVCVCGLLCYYQHNTKAWKHS